MRIGLVTCKTLPEPDPDAAPLERELAARGHEAQWVPWDDPTSPPPDVELFVMRSAWNYFEAPDVFLEWTRHAHEQARLINPPEVIAWNVHKGYLGTLLDAGVPVVPTVVLRQRHFDAASATPMDHAVVVKPAISAGSCGAEYFTAHHEAAARDYVRELLMSGDVIVQPYIAAFKDPGERGLVCIDGHWTHAVRKHPRFAGEHERVESTGPPSDAELKVARQAVDAIPHPVTYARADLVMFDGRPHVSELELIEPSLFFDHGPGTVERFVDMIEREASR